MKPAGMLAAMVAAVVSAACCPLEPMAEIRARLPQREFVEVAGQAVHFREGGKGGVPVLMIHGFGQSGYTFRELGPRLGRRVLAPDLNGFGYTERPPDTAAYAPGGQEEMLARLVAAKELRRIDIVAHSYGCEIALRLAAHHPQLVRRLVLISPALNMDVAPDSAIRNPLVREALYPLLRLLVCDRVRLRALFERAYFHPDVLTPETLEEYRRQLLVAGLHRAYRGFGAAIPTMKAGRVEIDGVSQPILILAGREDAIVPVETLPSSGLGHRVAILEEAGHVVPEEAPEDAASEIRRFLAGSR
ncbi:alpha/beta fold hydrolase [Haloferula sargassicola]|uniref:2-hydroxymuconate semialdehyde hydrolase n=1 Tax=Haloferula sargassicola TaxID=490096 RepID=A0ABP9UJY8_9BACT